MMVIYNNNNVNNLTCFEKGGDAGRRGGAFGVVCGHRHQARYTGLDFQMCVVCADIVRGAASRAIVIYMD
jgi:UDP-2,3-diacylglucosamine pyrophosphatase LpxH